MPGTILVTPKFLKPNNGQQISLKQKQAIKEYMAKQNPNGYQVSASIEDLLQKLNTTKSYNDIPEKIVVSYPNLIMRNVDLKDTYDVINLTARLAANKFNEKPKEILVTGHVGYNTIAEYNYQNLVTAGFIGCVLSPMVHGIEAAEECSYLAKKDPSYWSPLAVTLTDKVKVEKTEGLNITLTFRQEQILKMICTHGMTNHQIAKRLDLSESTVKMHIGLILKKYRAQHRSQLIVLDKQGRL